MTNGLQCIHVSDVMSYCHLIDNNEKFYFYKTFWCKLQAGLENLRKPCALWDSVMVKFFYWPKLSHMNSWVWWYTKHRCLALWMFCWWFAGHPYFVSALGQGMRGKWTLGKRDACAVLSQINQTLCCVESHCSSRRWPDVAMQSHPLYHGYISGIAQNFVTWELLQNVVSLACLNLLNLLVMW